MATKKVYFYKIDLLEVDCNRLCNYGELKDLIIEIIKNNATDNGKFKTLDLSIGNEPLHVMMDIYNYEGDRLFCRLSKQKPNNSMIKRDYSTSEYSNVLNKTEMGKNGIELYTYGSIDYATGLYSYVSAQSAPNERIIANLFLKFHKKYKIEMISIPNKDAIETVYFGEDPVITKIEIEVPVPNADIMEQIFNWNEIEITNAVTSKAVKAGIVIYPPSRESLVRDEDAQNVIDKMKECIDTYKKAKLTAKAKGVKSREYDLYEKYFSFPIEIPKYHMINNERIEYTIDELMDIYRQNLNNSFEQNSTILKTLTGRNG